MAIKQKVVLIDTQEAQTSVKDLRQQLKALKDIMLSTEQGTEEYNKALSESANIMHTLKEQTEQINASAMDFGQITGNVTKTIGGMVAGFQAAKATMNLFGVENEDVIKSLEKMQNLMAITLALPALDNGIKAFKRLSLVIKSATGAMNGFKAALVSTGLGAAVVALGLLITNWDKVTEAMKKWGIIHQTTAEKLEEEKKKAEDLRDKLNEARQAYADWEKQQKVNNLGSESKKQYDELLKEIDGAILKLKEFDAAMAGENNKEKWEALREQAREYEAIRDNAKAAQQALLDDANATKAAEEEAKKATEEHKKALEEMNKLQTAYNNIKKETASYSLNDEQKEILALKETEEEKSQIVRDYAAKKQISTEEAESQITAIHTHYEELRTEVSKKYAEQRAKDADEENKKKEEKQREEVEKALANIEFLYDQEILKISEKLLELSEQLTTGGINSEEYQEKLRESQEQELQALIESLDKQLEVENLTAELKLAIHLRLVDAKIALNEFQVKNAEDSANREVDKWLAAATGIGNIFSSLGDLMEEGSEEQKALQIMGATINMLAGITMAISGLFTTKTGPWDIALAAIQATSIATSGAATIAKMAKTNKDNAKSSGSNASAASLAVTTLQAPVQYTQDIQGAAIEGAIKDTKVYVLESDITDTQDRVEVTESESKY